MLEEIRISGLGVIAEAVLELAPGLTVVTGETGAGKTMVVQGLGLLFGGRADAGLVRSGAGRAAVEGRLQVDPQGQAARRAVDAGADLDDDVLLVSRTVSSEGRSRAYVGGRSVPVAVLAELAESLVAVHGQSDQNRLLRPARQRTALDRFAGAPVEELLGRYRTAYARWLAVGALLEELRTRERERAQEADLLEFGLAEVAGADLQPGEDVALAAEVERLGHADALRAAATVAHEALLGSAEAAGPDAGQLVAAARRAVEAVGAHDPRLGELATRLAEVSYLLADVTADLASYADAIDADPLRLAAAQDRQATIGRLVRKYAPDVDGVLAWARQARLRRETLAGDTDRTAELEAERAALRSELTVLAAGLSQARTEAAARFGAAVTGELVELAMPHAEVVAAVTRRGEYDFGPDGVDEVELLLVPHAGAPARQLQRGASGGELSRVMLAVEVVFAGADPVPTMVFDEVDAGVGGRAAVEVGRRLARLARTSQVLVVTHLPQVAAFADRHLHVVKDDDGEVTSSGVIVLDDSGRLRELSRMLAGLDESALARGHAEELLAVAATARAAG